MEEPRRFWFLLSRNMLVSHLQRRRLESLRICGSGTTLERCGVAIITSKVHQPISTRMVRATSAAPTSTSTAHCRVAHVPTRCLHGWPSRRDQSHAQGRKRLTGFRALFAVVISPIPSYRTSTSAPRVRTFRRQRSTTARTSRRGTRSCIMRSRD